MAANYRLLVKIEAEPDKRGATTLEKQQHDIPQDAYFGPEWDMTHNVWDYSRAAATYVEIENTGDVLNFDATELRVEDTYGGFVQPLGSSPAQSLRLELPRVGRPIVLLAVGGGNQEFDHWSDETEVSICAGQGARCEVPEPAEDYGYTLFAKAVFKKKPEDKRKGHLDPNRTRRRLPEPPEEP